MLPHPKWFRSASSESGIKRVCESWAKYFPDFGIHLVDGEQDAELVSVHAGESKYCDVLHCHGLYWTADYQSASWEWGVNSRVIDLLRMSKAITVPSEWVAETIRRDTKRPCVVVGHGIEWDEWQHNEPKGDYVLWNKNRMSDACNVEPLHRLAEARPRVHFVTTFAKDERTPNITEPLGLIPHDQMKKLVQSSLVYLSTTKETFGIGILEAMAAGVPVLGYAHGGILDLVQHGVNGYLAKPGNTEDLANGLDYCLAHHTTLGENGRELARAWTWKAAVEKVATVYHEVLDDKQAPYDVSVVIPCYNLGDKVSNAIESALSQTLAPKDIIVVDDGSEDNTREVAEGYSDRGVRYVYQTNRGVAEARNLGISMASSRYVSCLDADDQMAPAFLERCVMALKEDPALGIAYTGLQFVLPDRRTGISKWPGQWDFEAQLKKQNQVPTLCVFRKDMWQQLGGYKSRYCPDGAGSEDAEFWTRCGEYGWKAEKVTEEPLFIYSWQSGRVSGNKDYKEVDWLAWHPWAKGDNHLFASYAKPKKWSHAVRQYDEPAISVIIPVGPGHDKDVMNALDSLEAQTFRKWEAIVVNDTGQDLRLTSYPYVHIITTEGRKGAGYARNRGAEKARAPLLLWLDADDWLYPEALQTMLRYWETNEACIYSAYVGKAQVDDVSKLAENLRRNIQYRNEKTKETVIFYEAKEYDWQRAQRQPENQPWIWCNVTTLTPTRWHKEIGGFDEEMPAWEDVDYWYRMAFAGKPFVPVPEPLLVYLFYSGNRRDSGYRDFKDLIAYLRKKYEEGEIKKMPCSGCGSRRKVPAVTKTLPQPIQPRGSTSPRQAPSPRTVIQHGASDEDFVLCDYIHPNRGAHRVIGHAVFRTPIENMKTVRAQGGGVRIDYGYNAGGSQFYVHKSDLRLMPHLFIAVPFKEVEEHPEFPPPPQSIDMPPMAFEIQEPESIKLDDATPDTPLSTFDLQKLPGVGAATAALLQENGVSTLSDLISLGVEGLQQYRGVGHARAVTIIAAAKKQVML